MPRTLSTPWVQEINSGSFNVTLNDTGTITNTTAPSFYSGDTGSTSLEILCIQSVQRGLVILTGDWDFLPVVGGATGNVLEVYVRVTRDHLPPNTTAWRAGSTTHVNWKIFGVGSLDSSGSDYSVVSSVVSIQVNQAVGPSPLTVTIPSTISNSLKTALANGGGSFILIDANLQAVGTATGSADPIYIPYYGPLISSNITRTTPWTYSGPGFDPVIGFIVSYEVPAGSGQQGGWCVGIAI